MSTPILALIPSGYKEGLLYSQLPINGDGDLTFARTGTSGVPNATRVNEQGLIEDVNADVPRLDYSNGGCPVLLLEPSSTNLIEYSEDFTQWSNLQSLLTSNNNNSPKGNLTASELFDNSVLNVHRVSLSFDLEIGKTYNLSFFAKSNTLNHVTLRLFDGNTSYISLYDLDNENIVELNGNVLNAKIDSFANDWKRCQFSFVSTNTGSGAFQIQTSNGNSLSGTNGSVYVGNGQSLYIYGAQVEEQSYATSYIPTNGNIETRTQDTASKSGLENYINSSEGVLYAEINPSWEDPNSGVKSISIYNNNTNEYISIYLRDSNKITALIISNGGSNIYSLNSTYSINNNYKVAISYKINDLKFYINGVLVDSSSSAPILPLGLNSLGFTRGVSPLPFEGKVKDLRVYDTALTDQELTDLTS